MTLIALPGRKPQIYDNKPVCIGVLAWTVGGRRSGFIFKRENRQFLLGGWWCPKPLPTGSRWLSPGDLTRFPDEEKQ